MPLQPIAQTEEVNAIKLAERVVQDVIQLETRIKALRENGIPAQPAQAARIENGQNIPARPATPGLSAAAFNAALGAANCAIFDARAEDLGL